MWPPAASSSAPRARPAPGRSPPAASGSKPGNTGLGKRRIFPSASRAEELAALALRQRIPAIYQYPEFTAAGGLMSYGGSIWDSYHRAGVYRPHSQGRTAGRLAGATVHESRADHQPQDCQGARFLAHAGDARADQDWSLTSLKDKLIKIGAKVVSHGRYVIFQMAEVAIAQQMFQEILRLIAELRPQPPPALA